MRNNEVIWWVEKFDNGEFLHKWKGYNTILIGGPYSSNN
jgi:hypothetical protein